MSTEQGNNQIPPAPVIEFPKNDAVVKSPVTFGGTGMNEWWVWIKFSETANIYEPVRPEVRWEGTVTLPPGRYTVRALQEYNRQRSEYTPELSFFVVE